MRLILNIFIYLSFSIVSCDSGEKVCTPELKLRVDSIRIPDKDEYGWIKKIDSNAYSKKYSIVIRSNGKEYKFPDTGSIASHYVSPVYAVDSSGCTLYFNHFESYLVKFDLRNGQAEKVSNINDFMIDKEYEMHSYYDKLKMSIQGKMVFFEINKRKLIAFNKQNLKVMFTLKGLMKEKIRDIEKVFIYSYKYKISNGTLIVTTEYVLGRINGIEKSMTIKKEIDELATH